MRAEATISPTIERARKAVIEPPSVDRNVVRRAYKVLTVPEQLAKRNQISPEQLAACMKLERHYLGSLGVDVGDDDTRHNDHEVVEYAQSYHAEKLAQARKVLSPNEYQAHLMMIETTATVEDIGRRLAHWECRKMCKGYGLSVIHSSADRLIKLWGMQAHPG